MAAEQPQGGTHHLKAKFQIGSKRGRLNYAADEKVFHPSDVPLKAKEARLHVERSLRPDRRAGSGLPPPWDFGTVAGPAQSGTKTMPWDNDGWDDRHYAGVETAALVAKAEQKMARTRAGKTADDDPRNLHARWNVSTFVEPPKEMLLISVKHPLPGTTATAAAPSAGRTGDVLDERDIKRLVKKAVPIPTSSPTSSASGAGTATSAKLSANGRTRTADSKWLRDDRPTLKERVAADIEAQRAQKARARLATQHQAASAQLAALHASHQKRRSGPATAGSPAALRAEHLNRQISELTHQLGVSTTGGPAAVAAAVAAAAAAAPVPRSASASAAASTRGKPLGASTTKSSFVMTGASAASGASGASVVPIGSKPKAVTKRMEHTGVYEAMGPAASAAGAAGGRRECGWSCCLASDRAAPGCTAVGVSAAKGWNWTEL